MSRRFTVVTLALTAVVAFLVGAILAGGVVRSAVSAGAVFAAGPAVTADRNTPPAMIAPTKKATTAVSATVTDVKRRDISL